MDPEFDDEDPPQEAEQKENPGQGTEESSRMLQENESQQVEVEVNQEEDPFKVVVE